jgi:hypothetical protein
MARVSFANIQRLKHAKMLLEPDKNDVRSDLLQFIDLGIKFYRAYGMWSLINHYEYLIKKEDYTNKNFSRLSQEIYSMADQTLAICNDIKKLKADSANVFYCQTYIQLFEPTCVK